MTSDHGCGVAGRARPQDIARVSPQSGVAAIDSEIGQAIIDAIDAGFADESLGAAQRAGNPK
jgi:hypothetical protein